MIRCENIKRYFPVLRTVLRQEAGVVKAVDGVSLKIIKGETFGLVGESGSGKTTLGKIILGIIKPDSGKVSRATERLQVIFQDPCNSLDPKMRLYDILSEGLILKGRRAARGKGQGIGGFSNDEIRQRVEESLGLVRLPKNSLSKYPHQFSGGERQRIAIARAVLTEPEFIVCDEPVSSLDVTIQLEILRLLKEIQRKFFMTYLFISHDLRVVRFMSDRIAVMYKGRIVEEGATEEVYQNPADPYTKLLLSSILDLTPRP